ncbi:uncharacterized protein LOC134249073 [Saccostrea cucullata]|uniref:uncharacterized protein LOC134249073 n=1 Tax=Saccostrea cuccullata TaxID=36930 RepID=UPI002ED45A4D
MVCAMRLFECPICDFTNITELNVKRHIKRCHPGLGPNDELIKLGPKEQNKEKAGCSFGEENKGEESANEDWLHQDLCGVIGEISSANSSSSNSSDENEEDDIDEQKEKQDSEGNLLEGRLFRKKTQPTLPFTRKRPSLEKIPVPKKITCMDFSIQVDIEPAVTPVESNRVDAYTQTSPKKREVVTKTIRKYREGEADIRVVTKERLFYK